jgi:protein-L-isoaspartate(D-aspartate) O-methyltransferase
MTHDDRSIERHHCVERQLAQRDITDERVLDAMRTVPRHRFVSSDLAAFAYDDRPLPIGHDATISQPYIVALMAQALAIRPSDRVLEVGAGSGYAAAVMAELAAEVIAVECVEPLCELAARHLESYRERVQVVCADGSLGYPPGAPYDVISVAAAAPKIPPPLLEQLADGGRLVIPIGRGTEELVLVTRTPTGDIRQSLLPVRFVPLRGRHG